MLQQFRIGGCQELLQSLQPITSPCQVDDVGAASAVDGFGSAAQARAAAKPRSGWAVLDEAPRSWKRGTQDVSKSQGKTMEHGKNIKKKNRTYGENQGKAAPQKAEVSNGI